MGKPASTTSVARRGSPGQRHHLGGAEVAPDRPQGTSALGEIPEQEAGTRQFDRSEVRRVRALRPEIREGWPPHERTVQDGTAIQVRIRARLAAPTTRSRGRAEGRPRAWRRARHPATLGSWRSPRSDRPQGASPEAGSSRGSERPEASAPGPSSRAWQSRGPEGHGSGPGRELRHASRPAGGRGNDRHPRVQHRDLPGSRKESASTTTSVRMEKLSRPRPGSTWGAPASEAARPPPTAHGRGTAAAAPVAEARPRPQPRSPGFARESRAGRRTPIPKPGVPAGRAGESPGSQADDRRAEQCDPTVEQTRGSPEPRTATRQRPSGATPCGASRERLHDGRERDRSRSRSAGASRGWRRGASESGLRAEITSFKDRGEPSRGAREGWPR
jgi:hypothetical protein